jgi:NADH-quinone oxidoreductase subunit N
MAAVPMHIWVPDVYQTAPTPAVALFSVVPKVASLIVIFKIISLFATQFEFIGLILIVISMISMAVGNFSAIWQNDAKRMLGYSSIAHTGFLLVAIIANSVTGAQAFIYYAVVYLIMNFAAFLAVIAIEKQFATTDMRQYAGLGKYMPWMSVLVVVIMISLTGLPPTAGFTAKLLVFSSLWEAYSVSQNGMLLALFIFGLLNTVVALVYYLKIPYYLFFKETDALPGNVPASGVMMNLLGTILVLLLLLLFFKPDWLMDLIYNIKFAV